ncbi:hypothetical protein BY996DRAFT_6515349 [Phakopsora pachyrhizi]|nr:hypothetical protein BY996DRAFT_6515349 [Phakopsora pachyrhizi]
MATTPNREAEMTNKSIEDGSVDVDETLKSCNIYNLNSVPHDWLKFTRTIAGPTKARMRFEGLKFVRRIRKPWEGRGRRAAGDGKGYRGRRELEEKGNFSVGLVRRRETPLSKTDVRLVSGVSVNGSRKGARRRSCRRARRRHTGVWSSYHFRVTTKWCYVQGKSRIIKLKWVDKEPEVYSESNEERTCLDMTVLIDGKLEDSLMKDKKVSLLGRVICGQKISMGSVSEGSSCGGGSTN